MKAFNEIIELFEIELDIPNNISCLECDAEYKNPLLPWHIGEKYFSPDGGILFAGKPHRGTPGKARKSGILDARERANELYLKKSWAYWSYPKAILTKVYGSSSEGWKYIAFTNIIKCTSTNSTDKTSYLCADKCINNNQVIFEEIRQLKPRKIVLFTWSLHRQLLVNLPIAKENTVMEHTDINHTINCGKKMLGWWSRSFESTWDTNVDILVVGHPERMKKNDYIKLISKWLINSSDV